MLCANIVPPFYGQFNNSKSVEKFIDIKKDTSLESLYKRLVILLLVILRRPDMSNISHAWPL